MALFTVLKADVDDDINTNGIQAITGAIHNDILNDLIDAVGAAQVYINPAVTDNPGTPQNNRAYIALPGTYTNFGGVVVTAPIGVISWNGTSWSVTQLSIPSPHNYLECRLNAALTAATPYTTVNVSMLNGGITGIAGQWVQLINRRSGVYEFVQLTANVAADATAITFKSHTMVNSYPTEATIVEINPVANMLWKAKELFGDGTNSYVTVPATWRLLPVECTDPDVWLQNLSVEINGTLAQWHPTPVSDFDFEVDASNRLRIKFSYVLTVNDRVVVRAFQPRKV